MDKKIQKILEDINSKSTDPIAFVGEKQRVVGQSTGIAMLDFDIGCEGYPRGRITEIYGQEGTAKTSLALWGVAQAQRDGLQCLYIDAEYALDLGLAERLGVDLDKLIIIYPKTGEEAIGVVERMLKEQVVDFVVIDSVPSINPTPELEAEVGKPTMGGQARLWASALRRLVPLVATQKAVLLLINQVRHNIMGGQYDPWVTPGGKALKFYSSVRIELKRKDKLIRGDEAIGQRVEYRMKKNKVNMNNDTGFFDYVYNEGFFSELDIVGMAIKKNILTREGNGYFFNGERIAIGREKTSEAIKANPELSSQILEAIQQSRTQ